MGDFEDGEGLGESNEGLERFEETEELIMREEDWDEESRSEGDDAPEGEADTIVCQEIVLFSEEGLGALRLGPAGYLVLHFVVVFLDAYLCLVSRCRTVLYHSLQNPHLQFFELLALAILLGD